MYGTKYLCKLKLKIREWGENLMIVILESKEIMKKILMTNFNKVGFAQVK